MILVTSSLCCSHCQVQTGKVGHGYFPPPQSNIRNPNQSIGTHLLTSIAWSFHSVHVCLMHRSCYGRCAFDDFIDGILGTMVCIRLNRSKPSADGMILKHTQCLMQLELDVCCQIVFPAIAPVAVCGSWFAC